MKKHINLIAALTIIIFVIASTIGTLVFATESNLIQNVVINLKTAETPNRLEVHFDLTEAIDLSVGSADIIFEYFTINDNGELESTNYKKDKSWSGYLNIYENYPSGERKYSSGEKNENYSDEIPAATIYTSVRTGGSIDTAKVAAVKITVLKADNSGEEITVYSNVSDVNKNTGIRLNSTALELPVNTVLVANELTDGDIYTMIDEVLAGNKSFVAFDIKLKAEDQAVTPNGFVQLTIPIPQSFTSPYLKVYRIDENGTKTPYETNVITINGVPHVTFETDHFSTYALLELAVYPYRVEYYRDNVEEQNLIDTAVGNALFAEGHQLTAEDIVTELGESWINSKKPATDTGYSNGIIQGGYPVISHIIEDNIVKVLYKRVSSPTTYYTITVEYQDTSNNTISEKKSIPIEYGNSRSITAPAISGYRYNETIVNGTETFVNPTITIDLANNDYHIIFRYGLDRPVLNRVSHDWYINGYDDNTIRPDEFLTRAETAVIFYRLIANVDKDIKESRFIFNDINPNTWYAKAVTYLHDYDIISGYGDSDYRPDSFVTRAEIAKISGMFGNLDIPVTNTFSDVPETHWAYSYIASAVREGWIQGCEDGLFYPDKYASRAEIISLINKVLNRRVRTEHLLPNIHVWPDISSEHWAYADIMEATHTHTFTREHETDYEIWTGIQGTGADISGD